MNHLKIAQNLAFLRRRSGRTQEELAVFLGVTKASVSKWETGQSFPDITLLPRLASYFDVSVDELIGYQAQLTKAEIRKIYAGFSKDFENLPFDEVMKASREFAKEYYSCYPALFQICVLWLNHFDLADSPEKKNEILEEIVSLCRHIERDCGNREICRDAEILRFVVYLSTGRAEEVVKGLEPCFNPEHLMDQTDTMLVQAYQMTGKAEESRMFNQWSIYRHLITMLNDSLVYLLYQMQEYEDGMETINRLDQMIEIYHVDQLHPNLYLQFCYTCAQFYMIHGKNEKALQRLETFVEGSISFIKKGIELHGDSYFTKLDQYFQKFDIMMPPPRGQKTVWDSVLVSLEHPAFAPLEDTREMERWKRKLREGRENI